jgi:two-component system, OmpR family, sensor kinase
MLFDDRLATVLRSETARGETAARTQFRQLLDLLGSMPAGTAGPPIEAAYERLRELGEMLPATVQSAILRTPGLRLRNRGLAWFLAQAEPQVAAAAMAAARLTERDWLSLIPSLPVTARGFLRHRRDLPFSARQVLERLGVGDLALPEPDFIAPAPATPRPKADERVLGDSEAATEPDAGIGALVRRIEAFQRARRGGTGAPRLPLDDAAEPQRARAQRAFDFATDSAGVIRWADPAMAPLVVGLRLGAARPGATATLDAAGAQALARRLPLRGVQAELVGTPEIAGPWRVDAAPAFAPGSGHFTGHRGRMRRAEQAVSPSAEGSAGDRLRQLLHELRTPVGAIQGFAELIQQQLFGPAPNEYRALAAGIAVDAARLLAGFDELDRLARLEAGALDLGGGPSDLRGLVDRLLRRLDGVLRPRSARIELVTRGSPFTVGLDESEAMQLAWRLLATLAGALAPGELIDLRLESDGAQVTLEAELPAALLGNGDLFAASAPAPPRAITAGMFGLGFTLRLARAEAAATGGGLERSGDVLRLSLPVLTGPDAAHTQGAGEGGSAAA